MQKYRFYIKDFFKHNPDIYFSILLNFKYILRISYLEIHLGTFINNLLCFRSQKI